MDQMDMFEEQRLPLRAEALVSGVSRDDAALVVQIMDASAYFYNSMLLYQTGIVDCEMSRKTGSDRAAELQRLWGYVFTHGQSLGALLAQSKTMRDRINTVVDEQIMRLQKQHAEAEKKKKAGKFAAAGDAE